MTALATDVAALDRRSREFTARHFRARNTRLSYESAWRQFCSMANIRLIVRRRILRALIAWLKDHAPDDPTLETLRNTKTRQFVESRFTDSVIEGLLAKYDLPVSYNPSLFSSHSLRSGLVTTARLEGRPDGFIMDQSGHRSVRSLDGYTQSKRGWENNVARGLLD